MDSWWHSLPSQYLKPAVILAKLGTKSAEHLLECAVGNWDILRYSHLSKWFVVRDMSNTLSHRSSSRSELSKTQPNNKIKLPTFNWDMLSPRTKQSRALIDLCAQRCVSNLYICQNSVCRQTNQYDLTTKPLDRCVQLLSKMCLLSMHIMSNLQACASPLWWCSKPTWAGGVSTHSQRLSHASWSERDTLQLQYFWHSGRYGWSTYV